MNDAAIVVAIAGLLIQAGILLATVKFIGRRQDEYQKETRQDLNGLGRKERSIMAPPRSSRALVHELAEAC